MGWNVAQLLLSSFIFILIIATENTRALYNFFRSHLIRDWLKLKSGNMAPCLFQTDEDLTIRPDLLALANLCFTIRGVNESSCSIFLCLCEYCSWTTLDFLSNEKIIRNLLRFNFINQVVRKSLDMNSVDRRRISINRKKGENQRDCV